MPRSPEYTQQPWTETYSEIIDVRSESEFTEDRIPGAINLPVLNDAERAKVGTLYKQVCPFEARKVGASLVTQNIARHLELHFAAKDQDYYPLVYCWRGGQRSNSMALVLSQIGWQVRVLQGGYKTYRTYVRDQLERLPEQFTKIMGLKPRPSRTAFICFLRVKMVLVSGSISAKTCPTNMAETVPHDSLENRKDHEQR